MALHRLWEPWIQGFPQPVRHLGTTGRPAIFPGRLLGSKPPGGVTGGPGLHGFSTAFPGGLGARGLPGSPHLSPGPGSKAFPRMDPGPSGGPSTPAEGRPPGSPPQGRGRSLRSPLFTAFAQEKPRPRRGSGSGPSSPGPGRHEAPCRSPEARGGVGAGAGRVAVSVGPGSPPARPGAGGGAGASRNGGPLPAPAVYPPGLGPRAINQPVILVPPC